MWVRAGWRNSGGGTDALPWKDTAFFAAAAIEITAAVGKLLNFMPHLYRKDVCPGNPAGYPPLHRRLQKGNAGRQGEEDENRD